MIILYATAINLFILFSRVFYLMFCTVMVMLPFMLMPIHHASYASVSLFPFRYNYVIFPQCSASYQKQKKAKKQKTIISSDEFLPGCCYIFPRRQELSQKCINLFFFSYNLGKSTIWRRFQRDSSFSAWKAG